MNSSTNEANPSIRCSVASCQNHCNDKDYCALNSVKIGTHESKPTECQCVDCESFIAKND